METRANCKLTAASIEEAHVAARDLLRRYRHNGATKVQILVFEGDQKHLINVFDTVDGRRGDIVKGDFGKDNSGIASESTQHNEECWGTSIPPYYNVKQGDIVLYRHPGSADGKFPSRTSPAVVQEISPFGSARLFVFGPLGQHMDTVEWGDGPSQWRPRV